MGMENLLDKLKVFYRTRRFGKHSDYHIYPRELYTSKEKREEEKPRVVTFIIGYMPDFFIKR